MVNKVNNIVPRFDISYKEIGNKVSCCHIFLYFLVSLLLFRFDDLIVSAEVHEGKEAQLNGVF